MSGSEFGIVLCAGVGLRLRPLTTVRPKPLLRFLDRPIARYAFDALREIGVARIGANAFHLAPLIDGWMSETEAEWAADSLRPTRTELVVESELLGTGGGARGVWDSLGAPNGTVAVINGDVVADFPLEAMLKVHRRTGAVATLMTLPAIVGEGAVYLDETRHFVAQLPSPSDVWVSERYAPVHPVTFGGVYLLEPEVFQRLRPENSCLIRHGVGPLMAEGAIVASYAHGGFWADLGTPRRFLDATLSVLHDPSLLPSSPVRPRTDGVYVADPRALPADVDVTGPAFVAAGARVGRDVRLGPGVVVGAGCAVADGSALENVILMDGAAVEGDIADRICCGDVMART